jgi:hypothetical protein
MADAALTVQPSHNSYPAVNSHLSASIDGRGLVISGHDLGPGVSSIWGDSDYEHWLVVGRDQLTSVLEDMLRKVDREAQVPDDPSQRDRLLLALLEQAWAKGVFETDADFRRWLNAIHVPSEFSSYV